MSGDGQLALIGGPRDDDNAGAAWIFARTSSTWRQQGKKLTGGETTAKSVGWDVALSANGRMALIGSPGHAGGVFLFAHSGSRWVRRQRISRPGGGSGCSVSLSPSGNTAAIGTWTAASTTTTPDKGKAYVFTCSSFGCLVPGHELAVKRDTEVSDRYGRDVAVVDNRDAILVGAAGGPSLNKTGKPIQNGQAWVFLNWPFVESVLPSAGPPAGGTDVTITGENFTKVRAVSFGSTPAAQYTVDSSPKIRAVSPPGTGYVHVRVTTAIGISPELSGGWGGPYDGFRYLERPVVTDQPDVGSDGRRHAGHDHRDEPRRLTHGAIRDRSGSEPQRRHCPGEAGRLVGHIAAGAGGHGRHHRHHTGRHVGHGPCGSVHLRRARDREADHLRRSDHRRAGRRRRVARRRELAVRGPERDLQRRLGIDYSKGGSALPNFAHSGHVAVEQCVGVEFCTTSIRATFGAPQKLVRVWVGFSFPLNQPLQVELKAYAGGSVVGTATTTLPANAGVTSIHTPLEVQVGSASVTKIEVSVPGGYSNALAVDDVTFQTS